MPALVLTETQQEQAARVARPGEINGDLIDRFTLAHVASGAAAQRYGLSLGTTIAAAIAFEFAERSAKRRFPEMFPNPTQDTAANMIGDVIAAAVGWKLSQMIRKRRRQSQT